VVIGAVLLASAYAFARYLARIERLGKVIVRAHFQADDAIDVFALGRKHDDRDCLAGCAQATADGKTVFAGQHEVEDDEVRRVTLQFLVELARIGQRLDLQALFCQVANEKIAQARIVVDDKDFGAELFHRIAS
jgi:hypothetical protein